jgi:hypothetical protein
MGARRTCRSSICDCNPPTGQGLVCTIYAQQSQQCNNNNAHVYSAQRASHPFVNNAGGATQIEDRSSSGGVCSACEAVLDEQQASDTFEAASKQQLCARKQPRAQQCPSPAACMQGFGAAHLIWRL